MNRPVKKYNNSRRNLPFNLLLHPVGNNERLFPYPFDLVTEIKGVELDFYVNTGKKQLIGFEPGYVMTYQYSRKNRVQRNKKPLHSYIYEYSYTISDERVTL